MGDTPECVYVSIGRGVLTAQYFEQWWVNAYYHMRIVTEDGFSLSEADLSDHRLFKTPTKELLKKLGARSEISSGLEARIGDFLERRHTIVHRWFLINGSPFGHTQQQWRELANLADGVASEAQELSWLLIRYLRDWLGDSLANSLPADQQRDRMRRMFQELERSPGASGYARPPSASLKVE